MTRSLTLAPALTQTLAADRWFAVRRHWHWH